MPLPDNQSDMAFARIHFDKLFRQSQEDITDYSGKIWTDRGEHDPGVTLLQALTWTTSDMAYRHSFPLPDLLTPEMPEAPVENIFPRAFDASHVLTSAPVTLDDLRRGILDLPSPEKASQGYYFRNVRIVQVTKTDETYEHYRYFFDQKDGQFKFIAPKVDAKDTKDTKGTTDTTDAIIALQVLGDYAIEVELNRGVTEPMAKEELSQYLARHRHLTENYLDPLYLKPDLVKGFITLELDDDWVDYRQTLCELLKTVDRYIRPEAERVAGPAEDQPKEDLYQGPRPAFGWITKLPDASPSVIDIRPLARQILEGVPGVKSIINMTTGATAEELKWEWQVKPGFYALPWGNNEAEVLASVVTSVRFLKKGRYVDTSGYLEGVRLFMTPAPRVITDTDPGIPGTYRDPHVTYPSYKLLPAVYRPQSDVDGRAQDVLSALMLPYELWNYYVQNRLMALPASLSFERREKVEDPFDTIMTLNDGLVIDSFGTEFQYNDLEALAALPAYSELFHDTNQELNILQHLLSYFGETRAARTLLNKSASDNDAEYMQVQEGFLSTLADINYMRSVIDNKTVFSLQKRIAARLGIGAGFFASEPKINQLPFYVVENRYLLPNRPTGDALDKMKKGTPIPIQTLTLTADGKQMEVQCKAEQLVGLKKGTMMDLTLKAEAEGQKEIVYANLLIRQLSPETGKVVFQLDDDARLKNNVSVINAHHSRTLSVSPVMLRNKRFALTKDMYPVPTEITMENIPAWIMPKTALRVYEWGTVADRGNRDTDLKFRQTLLATLQVKGIDYQHHKILLTEGIKPMKGEGDKDKEVYFEVVPSEDNEAFSSTLTFVFPYEWIQGSFSEMTGWIEECVREEIPAHLNYQITYMDPLSLQTFGQTYDEWTKENYGLGGNAYKILNMLSLAERPKDSIRGIGVMRVANDKEATDLLAERNTGGGGKKIDDVTYTNHLMDKDVFFVGGTFKF